MITKKEPDVEELKQQVADLTTALTGCVHYLDTEMGWEFFRGEMGIGEDPPIRVKNAKKIQTFLNELSAQSPVVAAVVKLGVNSL